MTQRSGWTDSELARMRLEGLDHLNRLRSGEATDRDAAAFIAWRGQSLAHEEAFRAALRLRELVRTVETQPMDADADVIAFALPVRRHLTRRYFLGGAIAASAAGTAFLFGRTLDLLPSPAEAMADYRTGPGQRRVVQLAGGASVDLNTRTSIGMQAGLGMPAIALISGEAVLSSGRAERAALVAGDGVSVVRGGRFNARRDGGEVCITCLEGAVEVAWAGERRALRAAAEVRYDGSGIGPVKPGADAAVLTAWQTGTLIFRNMPMHQVVAEINRYRRGRVFLANSDLATRSLSGTYYVDRLDDFFSQAELALGINVARLPGNVVVLS
ncbi:FecR family protein [Sphingomonas psychrotolerans]|uniref:Iron dicitrate transport regulator FecR n=1 Tax=Sphingomonas psychrotolerans TaxID=1327635 RepID=A0A2K8MRV5_9SPHN|nr:FecR domain-containing protein [Sphingomonas psychrotolerans]ATY34211.1 iron dicitrate transport regulator FecR [Sphingomonas psychrotolerans]